jgi:dynein heavy chain
VNGLKERQHAKVADQNVVLFEEVNKALKQLSEEMKRIHEQQTDLEMMLTEYPQIDELKKTVKPYEELWKLADEHAKQSKRWRSELLSTLNPDEIEADWKAMQRVATKLTAQFTANKATKPHKVAKDVQSDLAGFKENLPLIRALCNPGLQERHKIEIGRKIWAPEDGADADPNKPV